jgi:hypothetical protein
MDRVAASKVAPTAMSRCFRTFLFLLKVVACSRAGQRLDDGLTIPRASAQ